VTKALTQLEKQSFNFIRISAVIHATRKISRSPPLRSPAAVASMRRARSRDSRCR